MIGFVCVVVLTILHFEAVRSENFLFLNGVGSPSHNLWNQVLIEGLAANKKYNLTVITPDVYNTSFSNLHYIHLEKTYEVMYSDDSPLDIIALSKETAIQNPQGLAAFSLANCKGVLQSEGLNTILNYPNDFKFDVVVYDFLCGPCLIPLLHKFGYPPLIAISALNTPQFKVDLIGGHQYPAYGNFEKFTFSWYFYHNFFTVPFFASDLPNYMNFYQRLYSYILYQWEHWYRKLVYKPRIEKMIRERYDFDDLPSHEELERNTVLMILNSNFALDYAEPIQPNVIHVGGLGIQEPKPLPEVDFSVILNSKCNRTYL
jgi:glucuronosyltransferase